MKWKVHCDPVPRAATSSASSPVILKLFGLYTTGQGCKCQMVKVKCDLNSVIPYHIPKQWQTSPLECPTATTIFFFLMARGPLWVFQVYF